MKKLLVSQRIAENDSYFEVREMLDISWGGFFHELGYLPIPVLIKYGIDGYFEELEPSGLILTGGNDLSIFSSSDVNVKRDSFEVLLLSKCLENKIPVIGVCRGFQLICRYFNLELEKIENHVAVRHKLKFTKYEDSYQGDYDFNSYHNYGIRTVPDEFNIVARADDGTIEAFEHKKLKISAQMWHPERENPFRQSDLEFFNRMLNREV